MSKPVTLRSPAKVNLFLEVLGKRPDGYHEIATVMQEVSLFDYLKFEERRKGIELRISSGSFPAAAGLSTGPDNLIYKAAALIKRYAGVASGVRITLQKNIPIGGGLGGGSSNAAYTLKGLNRLWKLGLAESELSLLAGEIGSDVPFFIYGRTALCKGRGEIVFPLPVHPQFYYLIVYPGFAVPTKRIYQSIRKLPLTKPVKNVIIFIDDMHKKWLGKIPTAVFNRLEETVFRLYPALKRLQAKLSEEKELLTVHVSGSGSSLFGIIKPECAPFLFSCQGGNRKGGDDLIEKIRAQSGGKGYLVKSVEP